MTPYDLADAEAAMRAALDSGDRARIDATAALVDKLSPPQGAVSLHSAALYYAQEGLRVFPLAPRAKVPQKGSAGFKDATDDPETITAWWTANPNANVGIATGHKVDVVDIDGLEGQTSRAQLWEPIFAEIEADCVAKILTPRKGGMHLYVPATGRGNGAKLAPGIDYRGLGGYVVAPPSVTDDGTYRFLAPVDLAGMTPVHERADAVVCCIQCGMTGLTSEHECRPNLPEGA